MLTSSGVSCVITKPTQVTSDTSSLIDHILTNDINSTIHPGVIQTYLLSDHYPFFCVCQKLCINFLNQKQATVKPTYGDYTNFTPESFKVDQNIKLIEFIENDLSTANIRRGVEDTRLEAKDTKKFRGQGPRTQTQVFSKKKKKRSSNFFFRRSQKKGLQKFFSGEKGLQKFFFRRSVLESFYYNYVNWKNMTYEEFV